MLCLAEHRRGNLLMPACGEGRVPQVLGCVWPRLFGMHGMHGMHGMAQHDA